MLWDTVPLWIRCTQVDIYAFGMCVLEMVTHEYPYSECSNAAQVAFPTNSLASHSTVEYAEYPRSAIVLSCLLCRRCSSR